MLSTTNKSEIIKLCCPFTITTLQHLRFLIDLVTWINMNGIEGDLVECGVMRGGCTMALASTQMKYHTNRNIYLYDTFEGMTKPKLDKDGKEAIEIFEKIKSGNYRRNWDKWHKHNKWCYCPLNIVQENMKLTKYPYDKIKFIKGDVNVTLNNTIPNKIAILRLDTDFYDSTMKELQTLVPKVSVGGYVIIDDYFAWKGSKRATDEFLKNRKDLNIVTKVSPEPVILKKSL